jgi:hypothetical protein
LSVGESGALAGVALPAGAQLVRTSSVRAVAEEVGQATATEGAVLGTLLHDGVQDLVPVLVSALEPGGLPLPAPR